MDKNTLQESQAEQTTPAQTTNGRRKFLQKASAGALIATIPAKSVWATGLTNSVVASGHGSDMAGGNSLVVKRPWYWVNRLSHLNQHILDLKFSDLFGGAPYQTTHTFFDGALTIRQVLAFTNDSGHYVYAGPSNFNRLMISAYLSAVYSDSAAFDVHFPVIGHNRSYPDDRVFAKKLYKMANGSPSSFALELGKLHDSPESLAGTV
ncbi:hypothetical protein ACFO4O_08170 [Glaciecola siphonariae]|uniref:Uncharacterized protein n=1 Tax=Glaciecola siphonariae TaxID=521012 RepID=A0ABV9LWA8_9ALTE